MKMKVSIFSRIYSWRRVFCPSVDMLCVWCGWKSGRNPSGRDGSARLDVCQMCAAFSCHRATRFIISVRRSRGPGIGKKGGEGSGGGAAAHAPACPEMRSFVNVFPRSAAAIYSRTELPSCHWLWAKKIVSIFQLFFGYETFGVKFCCKFIEKFKFNLNGLVMNGVVWDLSLVSIEIFCGEFGHSFA